MDMHLFSVMTLQNAPQNTTHLFIHTHLYTDERGCPPVYQEWYRARYLKGILIFLCWATHPHYFAQGHMQPGTGIEPWTFRHMPYKLVTQDLTDDQSDPNSQGSLQRCH